MVENIPPHLVSDARLFTIHYEAAYHNLEEYKKLLFNVLLA